LPLLKFQPSYIYFMDWFLLCYTVMASDETKKVSPTYEYSHEGGCSGGCLVNWAVILFSEFKIVT